MSRSPRQSPSPLRGGVGGGRDAERCGLTSRRPAVQELTGGRLHLSHGPIDVVLKAFGAPDAVARAHARRGAALSRNPARALRGAAAPCARDRSAAAPPPQSPVGRRMAAACRPFADEFITPMAAVAGSVADELLAVMLAAAPLDRAYVNDGGDIAVFCAPGQALDIAIAGDLSRAARFRRGAARSASAHGDGVGGIATSGARGRSFSLGIADSVTVLARDAATRRRRGDADRQRGELRRSGDRAPRRRPTLDPDSDLGERLSRSRSAPLPIAKVDARSAAGLAPRARLSQARADRRRRADAAGRNRDAGGSSDRPDGKESPRDRRNPQDRHRRRGDPPRRRAAAADAASKGLGRGRDPQSLRRPLRAGDCRHDGRAEAARARLLASGWSRRSAAMRARSRPTARDR